jgi:hypothetical protein
LDLSDAAPRQIPPRPCGTHGFRAVALGPDLAGNWARNLGPCRLGWRSPRCERPDRRNALPLPRTQNLHHHYHRHGSGTRPKAFWQRKRLLLPLGFRIRHPPLSARPAPRIGGHCGNRILAKFPAPGACQRSTDRRGERAHLRPLLAQLPPFSCAPQEGTGKHRPIPCPDRRRQHSPGIDRRGPQSRTRHRKSQV